MRNTFTFAALTVVVLALAACAGSRSNTEPASAASPASASPEPAQAAPAPPEPAPTPRAAPQEPIEWADVRAFIEYNSGDEDLGFHVEFDGEPWAYATMFGPDGKELFDLASGGTLRDQGLAGNFFESAEPPIDELSREEFFARFPEGEYTLVGETIGGQPVESQATFTHLFPDPPVIISPAEGATIDRGDVTVSWEPVTSPSGTEVEVYVLGLSPEDPPRWLQTVARRRPRSATYRLGMRPPCVLGVLGFRRPCGRVFTGVTTGDHASRGKRAQACPIPSG